MNIVTNFNCFYHTCYIISHNYTYINRYINYTTNNYNYNNNSYNRYTINNGYNYYNTMQQLKVEQKNTEKKDRRSGKGRVIALSRRTYRLLRQTDVFYVESESTDGIYYFVKYKPDVLEFCSCKDYESNRTKKCKHIFGVEF